MNTPSFFSPPQLYMFLANRDTFTTALKTAMDGSIKDDDVLEDLAETCGDLLENKAYVFPETKHDLLKALAFTLVLLDKEGIDKKKDHLFKNKKSMDKFIKVIKVGAPKKDFLSFSFLDSRFFLFFQSPQPGHPRGSLVR